jgi:hypothetical protein
MTLSIIASFGTYTVLPPGTIRKAEGNADTGASALHTAIAHEGDEFITLNAKAAHDLVVSG